MPSLSALPPKKLFTSLHWQACFEAWLLAKFNKSGSQRTRYLYERELRRFFGAVGKTPTQVTQDDVLAYMYRPTNGQRSSGKPPAPNTVNSRLMPLKSFYAFAARYTVTQRGKPAYLFRGINPTDGMGIKQAEPEMRTFSDEEVKSFFAAIPRNTIAGKRDYALFLAYCLCGRRRVEISLLRWGDIEQVTFSTNTGQTRTGWLYSWKGKGRIGREHAELPEIVWSAIEDYLQFSERREAMQPDTPIFVRAYGRQDKALHESSLDDLFQKYRHAAGIRPTDKYITLHSLRHTAARLRWEDKPDFLKVMKFLGHKSPVTTMRYLDGILYEADTASARIAKKFEEL